ncbi:MAG: hypothetical protein P4M13_08135 [Alphaproteobacteria bacterium]|nr:hypothetical protein [Alphaproteobacteria bacterium]
MDEAQIAFLKRHVLPHDLLRGPLVMGKLKTADQMYMPGNFTDPMFEKAVKYLMKLARENDFSGSVAELDKKGPNALHERAVGILKDYAGEFGRLSKTHSVNYASIRPNVSPKKETRTGVLGNKAHPNNLTTAGLGL